MKSLFDELVIKDVRLRNRIGISPMCQYLAEDGVPNEWHHVHLGSRAVGGAALVIVEATAVSPEARITWGDTGLWNDAQTTAFAPIARFLKSQGAVAGIQLAHAGRKASAARPWEGGHHLSKDDPHGWDFYGPTAEPFGGSLSRAPIAMTTDDIERTVNDFANAAKRAIDAGFEWLELHFAHGYLAQTFFSPLVNKRTDAYGGDFAGRARFLLEIVDAVRAVWPERLPLTARLGVRDFNEGEQPFEESIELARQFKAKGLDLLDASIGGNLLHGAKVPFTEPAFMAPYAARIRRESGILTAASWNVGTPKVANACIEKEELDMVLLAKSSMDDPYWPVRAGKELGRANAYDVLPQPMEDRLKPPTPR